MVVQHKLRCGEVGLALDSELVGIVGELGALDPLHGGRFGGSLVAGGRCRGHRRL
jgi:hypothetical protein